MGRPPLLDSVREDVGYLHPHHRAMARMQVTEGLRPGELAVRYNMRPCSITAIVHSPLYKKEVARLEALAELNGINIRKELELLQPRALEILAEDMHEKGVDRKLRNATAFRILDKTGFPDGAPIQRSLNVNLNGELNPQEMSKEALYREVMDMIDSSEDEEEGR
jgi:hypothetical protein